MIDLAQVDLRREDDVVRAHQAARSIASRLGFSAFEQTRIATAVSEIARNALIYAGGGIAELGLDDDRTTLVMTVYDHGPGIADIDAVLRGERRSTTGMGLGVPGARRLMDTLDIDTGPGGTRVVMRRRLPRRVPASAPVVAEVRAQAAERLAEDPRQELRRLQRDVADRDQRILELTDELDHTNRGVLALSAELEERAEYQRQAIELKTRLVTELGHELRTPLHSIVQVSQFMIDRLDGPLTAEQDRQAHIIHDVGRSLTDYVNDLLDLSRADAGKTTVQVAAFSLRRLLGTLRRMMQPLVGPHVALVFVAVPDGPALETDESKLSQILRNLVANAIKFTERGAVTVRAQYTVDDLVMLEVHDTGIGIAREHHETIFEEFAQVEGPIQRVARGTGLGLPLVRRLARVLGGDITLDSAPGAGSTFRLVVPRRFVAGDPEVVVTAAAPTATAERAPIAAASAIAGRPRILIVDDDAASRYVLRRWLEDRFTIEEADGGVTGLALAAARPPAAIFLDVVMPDLTGFEVLERLGQDPTTVGVPVIVYSALTLGANDRRRLGRAKAILRKSTASRVADRTAVESALVTAGLATMLGPSDG